MLVPGLPQPLRRQCMTSTAGIRSCMQCCGRGVVYLLSPPCQARHQSSLVALSPCDQLSHPAARQLSGMLLEGPPTSGLGHRPSRHCNEMAHLKSLAQARLVRPR